MGIDSDTYSSDELDQRKPNSAPPGALVAGLSEGEASVSSKKESSSSSAAAVVQPAIKEAADQASGAGVKRMGGRIGGTYVPPHMRMSKVMEQEDEETRQRETWEMLRRKLNGLINKISVVTIKSVVPEMFRLNLVRGKGLMIRAIMKAQQTSPSYTHVYAALVSIINTKIPQIGELLLKRVVFSFKRAYKRRDKAVSTASVKFIAHLMNQYVAHEILVLQLLAVLLEDPTNDSVEIAVNLIKEAGQRLHELSPRGLHAVFERLRGILHESDIDKRTQYIIEGLFNIRKEGFTGFPAIVEDLDLVERDEQITFELGLDEEIDKEDRLDRFHVDPDYAKNEEIWDEVRRELIGSDEEGDEGDEGGEDGAPMVEGIDESDEGAVHATSGSASVMASRTNGRTQEEIVDLTDQDLINLRRVIYLTIMSAASFEEGAHKLAKLKVPAGYETELANMLIECCANEKSFQKHYGLMGQRLCMMRSEYREAFCSTFTEQYSTIHRLETNKLRNVGKFFSSLLYADSVPWTCLACIQLSETETTSSSRIFIKILLQELTEALGLAELRNRLMDPSLQETFSGLFPKDTPRNTRFAINYFTSIGLGSLTDDLREYLKNAPKLLAQQMQAKQEELRLAKAAGDEEDSESSSSSSSSSLSSSDSDSDSSDSGSDSSDSGSDSSDSDSDSSDSDSSDNDSDSDSSASSSSGGDDDSKGPEAPSKVTNKRKASPEGESSLKKKRRS